MKWSAKWWKAATPRSTTATASSSIRPLLRHVRQLPRRPDQPLSQRRSRRARFQRRVRGISRRSAQPRLSACRMRSTAKAPLIQVAHHLRARPSASIFSRPVGRGDGPGSRRANARAAGQSWGANPVIGITRSAWKRRLAEKLGADMTFPSGPKPCAALSKPPMATAPISSSNPQACPSALADSIQHGAAPAELCCCSALRRRRRRTCRSTSSITRNSIS